MRALKFISHCGRTLLVLLALLLSIIPASGYASNPSFESGLNNWNSSVVYPNGHGYGYVTTSGDYHTEGDYSAKMYARGTYSTFSGYYERTQCYLSQSFDMSGDTLSIDWRLIRDVDEEAFGALYVYIDGSTKASYTYSSGSSGTSTSTWNFDISGYDGVHELKFYLYAVGDLTERDSASMTFYVDNIRIDGLRQEPPDFNSTSYGSVNWRETVGYVGQSGGFYSSATKVINPNLEYQDLYLFDDDGYVDDLLFGAVIDDDEEYYYFNGGEYDPEEDTVSYFFTEPGTVTLYLYEEYGVYNSSLGATQLFTRLLDSDTIIVAERPFSSKSEIWTNSELITNNTIRFYWDIVGYDEASFDYAIEFDPDPDNMPLNGLDQVTSASGYIDKVYHQPGTYTVHLERGQDFIGDWDIYSDLDSFTFTIEMDDDDNDNDPIVDPPEEPNSSIPGPLDPPETPEVNETLNSSLLQAYYNGVDSSVNSLHSSLSGIVSFAMSPVNSMSESVSTMASVGTSSINAVSMYLGPVGVILQVLFASLPDEVIHIGTFFIFLVGFVFIWKGAQ